MAGDYGPKIWKPGVINSSLMGAAPGLDRRPLHFGVFELNLATGELRKHGVRVRLQDQPLKLLRCLIETPGELRTREDLIRKIWPEGTFVDYERGLNVAVTRLRQVLGDSADTPRYIETLGRKGYRFIAPVERPSPESVPPPVEPAMVLPAPAEIPQPAKRGRWWFYAAIAFISVAIAAAGWWRGLHSEPQPVVRVSVELGPDMPTAGFGAGSLLAISRDGSHLAVSVSGPDGKVRLATRRLDQSQFTVLSGTEGGASPFFSPDGRWIAFFADGKLKKIAREGGEPVTLCDADTHAAGRASIFYPTGSWGDDGSIIAALNVAVGLSRIPAAGGPPALLNFKREQGEIYRWPQVLPGGEAVLFTVSRGDYEGGNIEVFSIKTGERKMVQQAGIVGRYLPSGHLVFLRRNALMAALFDPKALKVVGAAQPVLEDMGSRLGGWNYDFSQNGRFVYASQPRDPGLSIFWLDRKGDLAPLQTLPGSYASPRFSPEGKRLAFSMTGRSPQSIWVQDIWVQDLELGSASPLTLPGANDSPLWTADGRSLIFRSVDQPNPGIYLASADGGGKPRRVLDLTTGVFPASLSSDGKRLATWELSQAGTIWTAPVEDGSQGLEIGKPELFLRTTLNPPFIARTTPAFSPDGHWLAYSSLESGQIEIYVRPFPGPGGKVRVSTSQGTHPVWSRNGRELFYLTRPPNRIMVATYRVVGNTFVSGEPKVWCERPLLDLGELYSYDAAPDGKRLAVVLYADGSAEQKPATSLAFLMNFFDELRRRMPTDGK